MTNKAKIFLDTLPVLDHSVKCNSVMIIPNGKMHDSGFETMTYVISNSETNEQYKTNGSSDVLDFHYSNGFRIECIPEYHAVRLWRDSPFNFIPWYSTSSITELDNR